MFETEIKEIRNKLARSLRLWRKAEKFEKEISKAERDDKKESQIYWIGASLDGKGRIYEYAGSELNYFVKKQISYNLSSYSCYNSKGFKKVCEEAQNLKNSDILEKLKSYVNSAGWDYIKPEINKDTITIGLRDYNLPLLLSSLNILINNDIETSEIIDKAHQALKDCNTFVYRGIKITIYKNGKTKLVFSDDKTKNIFLDKII